MRCFFYLFCLVSWSVAKNKKLLVGYRNPTITLGSKGNDVRPPSARSITGKDFSRAGLNSRGRPSMCMMYDILAYCNALIDVIKYLKGAVNLAHRVALYRRLLCQSYRFTPSLLTSLYFSCNCNNAVFDFSVQRH